MIEIFSIRGLDIFQRDFKQIVLRSNGDEKFKEIINKKTLILPPSENLQIKSNENFFIAKHSFDQWNMFYFQEESHKEVLKFVSEINSNENMLASDYSYGQIYFEISGEKKNYYLNKLTHFDLRPKKFPIYKMAQTLLARIDCSIYHFKDKYIISCNKSFEKYIKERLTDSINI